MLLTGTRRLAAAPAARRHAAQPVAVIVGSLRKDSFTRKTAEALVKLDYKPAIPHLLMALEANVAGDTSRKSPRIVTTSTCLQNDAT